MGGRLALLEATVWWPWPARLCSPGAQPLRLTGGRSGGAGLSYSSQRIFGSQTEITAGVPRRICSRPRRSAGPTSAGSRTFSP